jgi:hypothetical protein
LYCEVYRQIERVTRPAGVRRSAVRRLALLVTGIVAARSSVLAEVAAKLHALGLTRAGSEESVARGLRRALGDARLDPASCYAPMMR